MPIRAAPAALVLLVLACPGCPARAADSPLPAGPSPAPVDTPHFPDRMHAFVWRNWNVVDTGKLAAVLDASADDVRGVAAAMGLPPEEPVPPAYRSRLYLTVTRRNWHLLPYDQLLHLLDMTPEQLAVMLREDDFLWIKLGNLKPNCEPVRWAPPDEAAKKREAEIKRAVEEVFGPEMARPAEKRFAFLDDLAGPAAPTTAPTTRSADDGPRFLYSYFAVYGDPLSDPSLDPYPDALLARLSALGVNGVWLHAVLRDLAPSADFPEFGRGHAQRLENLRKLVQRAKRYGVGIYLYTNEPRAMPATFFKDKPGREGMAGVREGDYVAMCTSDPTVRRWLGDSLAHVFTAVPDLAGVFTITASENLTSCASHHHQQACPRCKARTGPDIISEVNATIEAGVHRGNPNAKVIAWDWGWPDDWAEPTIARLPKSCWLMSVSEWSQPLDRGGVKTAVGEYSLSAVGPGPRARRHWQLARAAGLKTVAKVQANNSWELSAVPYLPVMDLVAEHAANRAAEGVEGTMLSWTLGGYPSPNLEVVRRFATRPAPTKDTVLDAVAAERYGPGAAPAARRAWRLFSDAFREYPFDGNVVYRCPVQLGPANLLYAKPTGYASTMVGFPYDDAKGWSAPYGPAVLAQQFQKVADGWDAGEVALREAVGRTPADRATAARGDLRLARAAVLHFRSVDNQTRFVLARDAAAKPGATEADRRDRRQEVRRIVKDEERLAVELWRLTREDARIGFEASNQYYYLPQDLMEKVLNCRWIVTQLAE